MFKSGQGDRLATLLLRIRLMFNNLKGDQLFATLLFSLSVLGSLVFLGCKVISIPAKKPTINTVPMPGLLIQNKSRILILNSTKELETDKDVELMHACIEYTAHNLIFQSKKD